VASPPVAALAAIPVGPLLSAALAKLVLRSLSGHDLVWVLRARDRQGNHDRGHLLQTVAAVLHRGDPDDISEVRAALRLTRPAGACREICVTEYH
jgi:hypothetical protein